MEDECYKLGFWFILFGAVVGFVYLVFLVPVLPKNACFFWKVLGLYCPGCGGTRAVDALLHGKIISSLWYHPLVVYTVVIFGGFMVTHTMQKLSILHIKGWKFHNWYLYGALGVVIVNWVLKNVLLLAFDITL